MRPGIPTSSPTLRLSTHTHSPQQISRLLADTFVAVEFPEELMDTSGAPFASPATVLQYQLKLLAALQWRASTLGRRFVTISAADAESGQLAGVANVAPGMTLAEAEGHVKLGPGEATATLSNMAVAPPFRRRGLGRILLQAAEQVRDCKCDRLLLVPAVGRMRLGVVLVSPSNAASPWPRRPQAALEFDPPTTLMALAVYKARWRCEGSCPCRCCRCFGRSPCTVPLLTAASCPHPPASAVQRRGAAAVRGCGVRSG